MRERERESNGGRRNQRKREREREREGGRGKKERKCELEYYVGFVIECHSFPQREGAVTKTCIGS